MLCWVGAQLGWCSVGLALSSMGQCRVRLALSLVGAQLGWCLIFGTQLGGAQLGAHLGSYH
jgi:hypothetical protein